MLSFIFAESMVSTSPYTGPTANVILSESILRRWEWVLLSTTCYHMAGNTVVVITEKHKQIYTNFLNKQRRRAPVRWAHCRSYQIIR